MHSASADDRTTSRTKEIAIFSEPSRPAAAAPPTGSAARCSA